MASGVGAGPRRFTPTCVGTTSSVAVAQSPVFGSPPRAWGRRMDRRGRSRGSVRFTPTCVGTTARAALSSCSASVHPHVRGDDRGGSMMSFHAFGSPPRAWGRPGGEEDGEDECLVHPHVRGDDRQIGRNCLAQYGSPPRAWGRPDRLAMRSSTFRFTPTCVGTTEQVQAVTCGDAVHPHVRGDDGQARQATRANSRFTPTCVGTTSRARAQTASLSVHPHVRGDDTAAAAGEVQSLGSPPRAGGRRHPPCPRTDR